MQLDASSTLTDVAFSVCTALERADERAILCGGSAATFYAPEAYESRDLDFILRFGARAKTVDEALRPLGYLRAPERLYRHPDVLYTVEFPTGPPSIGSETVTAYATEHSRRLAPARLHADRRGSRSLHALLGMGDQRTLRVALDVAAAQSAKIDVPSIEAWTERELREAPVYDRGRRDYFLSELKRALNRCSG